MFDQTPYILDKTLSWLDSYLLWANATGCCMVYTYPPELVGQQCIAPNGTTNCTQCFEFISSGATGDYRPEPSEFYEYLPWFFNYEVTDSCAHPGIGTKIRAIDATVILTIGTTRLQRRCSNSKWYRCGSSFAKLPHSACDAR